MAVCAIKHIEESIAVSLQKQLAWLTLELCVNQHWHLDGIPVVQIVWCVLIKPLELAGRGVQSEHRTGVEIVTEPLIAVVVGTGISGGPVEQTRFGIEGARQPRGRAAMFDRPTFPRF